jgi:hypothetical protein
MGGGESRDREAGAAVSGQPADDNPAAATRSSVVHRGAQISKHAAVGAIGGETATESATQSACGVG